jgi:hypothetical protein
MSRLPPKVTCLFFSDVSVAAFLNTTAGRTLAGDLLVECSRHPALGYLLNVETPANFPGVTGLLGGVDVGTLAHPAERLPAPIILAPGMPVSTAALRAALACFRRADDRLDAVTLLVPLAHARELGAALAGAERFAIAWDVAAFPHEELVEFATWLAGEKLLTAENFAGLFPYAIERQDPAHVQRIIAVLAPLAARVPAIRADLAR